MKAVTAGQLRILKKLDQKKYREEYAQFIVEGPHLVGELLDSHWEAESILIRKDAYEDGRFAELLTAAAKRGIRVHLAGRREFDSAADTVSSQGILAVARIPGAHASVAWGSGTGPLTIVGLNNISDPGNLGTIMRTCAWFGVDYLVLDAGSVEVFNPKVVRATMGALFHLAVIADGDLNAMVADARVHGVTVYSTTLREGVPLEGCTFGQRAMLLLGNESRGLDEELRNASDISLVIPKYGTGESLNVAVAGGIVLQRAAASRYGR